MPNFYKTLGAVKCYFCCAYMRLNRFIKGRGNHFSFNRAVHIGNFFGAFVHQQDHDLAFGVVYGDGVGDLLQLDGLARTRRSYQQASLAFADGTNQVQYAHFHRPAGRLQLQLRVRIDDGLIDGLMVNGSAFGVAITGAILRLFQNGLVRFYAWSFAVGVTAFLVYLTFSG